MSQKEQHSHDSMMKAIERRWREIAARLDDIPCLSQHEILSFLQADEQSLTSLEDGRQILVFRFNGLPPRYPLAQFDTETQKIYPVVPAMMEYLGNFDDWVLLDWITSKQLDIGARPIDVLSDPAREPDITEAAKFYYANQIEPSE